jgi:membrane peptidoglycan carboxypeptidase
MTDQNDQGSRRRFDDDMPFKLPREEDLSTGDFPREPNTEELRAQDPPLKPTAPQSTIEGVYEEIEPVDPNARTDELPGVKDDDTEEIVIPNEAELAEKLKKKRFGYEPREDDIPFKLPREDELRGPRPATMPHDRSSAPTLAGSGGFDPNPDFPGAQQTMRHAPVSDQTVQQRAAQPTLQHMPPVQYAPPVQQRPAQGPAYPPPAQQALPRRPQPVKKTRRVGCLAIFLGVFLTFCGGLSIFSIGAGLFAYARVGDLLNERLSQLDTYTQFQSTFLLDRNGNSLYEVFNEGRRTKVQYEDLPRDLINATISIEDGSFWENIGIDIPATTVALLQFMGANRDDAPGGSTITQQLVRNVLFDPAYRTERSATRKAEEILLAIALTGRTSKEEVLELYINEIYYGNLAYGAQAASQIFFGKNVQDLTLGEAALLAGLPQAPANLDPFDPDPTIQAAVENRWKQVLNEMVEEGHITGAQRDQALQQGYTLVSNNIQLRAPHFTVYAQKRLESLMIDLGYSVEEIARGGLRVYTSVDLSLNDFVQETVRNQIAGLRASNNVGNGAAVVLKPTTGEILAMVGSADYDDESIDGRVNVTTAFRQPGSTVKAFTYAAALELGMSAGDVIWDTRTRIGIPGQPMYEPRNYDGRFHGPMRMRTALANSYNIPAVQTLRHRVGVGYLIDFMRRFGIESLSGDASQYGLSLTLGGGEVSLLELTNGYGVFARDGLLVQPQAILCVLNSENEILYNYENNCPGNGVMTSRTVEDYAGQRRVLDDRVAFLISSILSDNNARTPAMGSRSALYTPGINSAVKTGTTDDNKDNWTVGYTKNVAVGVWVGNSRGEPMVGTSGLTGAAPIWNAVITGVYNNSNWYGELAHNGQLANDEYIPPQGISQQRICDLLSLQDPATDCNRSAVEWFLDYPAGVPSGDGGMFYPDQVVEPPIQQPQTGSFVFKDSPGVFRAIVAPIAPEIAAGIQFNVEPGRRPPPAPKYCRLPMELLPSTPSARDQMFIEPPPDGNDAAEAEEYARSSNLAFLPTIDCVPELLGGGSGLQIVIPAYISQPVAGQSVPPEGMPIIGTVQFSPGQVSFYRLLIRGGNFPDWVTIGDISTTPVTDGQLGFLPGYPGLQPGNYELRLEIIANDSSLLQPPVGVPFRIE